ncbi:MAG TPA: VTT domain-containing protein [Anaerolineae bacterium]|nr:VTT domain-containing protein [Anaerolineae bacterium]
MIDPVLELVATYGVLGLGVALILAAAGLPLPTGALLLAVGALARDGVLDWRAAAAVALAVAVLGDLLGYGLGRLAGGRVVHVTSSRRAMLWQRAQALFHRHGALAIWLTRFLLTSLDKPASVIVGGIGYDLGRFVACSVAGRTAWLALYGGVGYAFGGDWHAASQVMGSYGGPVAAAAVVVGGLYLIERHERCIPPM